jgi:hypothetical protein
VALIISATLFLPYIKIDAMMMIALKANDIELILSVLDKLKDTAPKIIAEKLNTTPNNNHITYPIMNATEYETDNMVFLKDEYIDKDNSVLRDINSI